MSADNVENSTTVSNRATSLEVSSPHPNEVAEHNQSVDILTILNRMNDSIMHSNQLLVRVARGQGNHGRAPCISDSDSDIGDFLRLRPITYRITIKLHLQVEVPIKLHRNHAYSY